jgi:hypothetical protein
MPAQRRFASGIVRYGASFPTMPADVIWGGKLCLKKGEKDYNGNMKERQRKRKEKGKIGHKGV